MSNNLGLFITHHIFLTEDQKATLMSANRVSCVGHCVPVWVDAKTGKTTEPAKEIFCWYEVLNVADKTNEIALIDSRGYQVWLPRASSWRPPPPINFEAMADWTEEKRADFLKERDLWWFNNPRPPDAEDVFRGYLRFEVKKQGLKIGKRSYSAQNIIEIASTNRLIDSLTA